MIQVLDIMLFVILVIVVEVEVVVVVVVIESFKVLDGMRKSLTVFNHSNNNSVTPR